MRGFSFSGVGGGCFLKEEGRQLYYVKLLGLNFPGGGGLIPPTPPRSAYDHLFSLEFDILLPP